MRYLFLCFLLIVCGILSFAQNNQDTWLITKVGADPSKVNASMAITLKDELVPQAFDRNYDGEFLFVSQKSPPATRIEDWQLERYKSELDMLEGIKKMSLQEMTPVGLDVQDDGAFVQYVKNDKRVNSVRLVKVENADKMLRSIDSYQKIGFFLNGLSTFEDQLWLLFIKYKKTSVDDYTIRVISDEASSVSKVISQGLKGPNAYISGITFTDNEKVLIVFTEDKL